MKINLETTELWVTKAERWWTTEEEREVNDVISFLLIHPFGYGGLICEKSNMISVWMLGQSKI